MSKEIEQPLTLEELRHEMESKGWTFDEVEHDGKNYISFCIGKHPDWSFTPLFELYYTERSGEGEMRLRKGLSQWSLCVLNWPPLPSDIECVFRLCSEHA